MQNVSYSEKHFLTLQSFMEKHHGTAMSFEACIFQVLEPQIDLADQGGHTTPSLDPAAIVDSSGDGSAVTSPMDMPNKRQGLLLSPLHCQVWMPSFEVASRVDFVSQLSWLTLPQFGFTPSSESTLRSSVTRKTFLQQ